MKFTLIGQTTFAWAEFLKEFPSEHLLALNKHGGNVQSISAAIKLITALDCDEELGKIEPPPYVLELFNLLFWFELPFTLVEEIFSKTRVRGVNVAQARTDTNKGLLVGTIGAWIEFCNMRGKPYVSNDFNILVSLVISVFERQSLTTLLN